MKYAIFFRNVNLGRPKSPTRLQLEGAFLQAGVETASSFLTNGTIVVTTKPRQSIKRIMVQAREGLQRVCGLVEPGFEREVAYLAGLVAAAPFAKVDLSDVYDCYATFLDEKARIPPKAVLHTSRRDVEVICTTAHEALSVARKITQSPGSPNAFLEKLLGLPATTRAWNTVVRLVAKHG